MSDFTAMPQSKRTRVLQGPMTLPDSPRPPKSSRHPRQTPEEEDGRGGGRSVKVVSRTRAQSTVASRRRTSARLKLYPTDVCSARSNRTPEPENPRTRLVKKPNVY